MLPSASPASACPPASPHHTPPLGIAMGLYLLINGLFIFKYGLRIAEPLTVAACAAGYSAGIALLFAFYRKASHRIGNHTCLGLYILLTLTTLAGIALLHLYVDPLTLKVDRWSALYNFSEFLLQGKYPYDAPTHLGGYGSPFPVWQFVHTPFYLLGDVGYGFSFFYLLLAVSLPRFFPRRQAFFFLLMLSAAPAFWYEAAVRSDLIYNILLLFLLILAFRRYGISPASRPVLCGMVCGLMLSTRITTALPFLLLLFRDFLQADGKRKTIFLTTAVAAFLLSFLPILLWNSDRLFHFEYSPLMLQTRQGTYGETLLILALCLWLALRPKDFSAYCLHTAVVLLLLVGVSMLVRMTKDGFQDGLFTSTYDITYYTMALPFLLVVLLGMDDPKGKAVPQQNAPPSDPESDARKMKKKAGYPDQQHSTQAVNPAQSAPR